MERCPQGCGGTGPCAQHRFEVQGCGKGWEMPGATGMGSTFRIMPGSSLEHGLGCTCARHEGWHGQGGSGHWVWAHGERLGGQGGVRGHMRVCLTGEEVQG